MTKEQAKCAAEFWMNALRNPKFDTLGKSRHELPREQRDPTEFGEMLANVVHAHNRQSEEAICKFGEVLEQTLLARDSDPYCVAVDYDPDALLSDCAKASGLRNVGITTFPWKTCMWFQNGGVQVACGYGAECVEILKVPA